MRGERRFDVWYRGLLEVKGRMGDRGGGDRRGETSPR